MDGVPPRVGGGAPLELVQAQAQDSLGGRVGGDDPAERVLDDDAVQPVLEQHLVAALQPEQFHPCGAIG